MLGGMTTSITVHFNVTKEDITKVSAGLICSKLLPLSSTEREKKKAIHAWEKQAVSNFRLLR